ncbi:MAG: hypothetical protein ACM3Q2_11055 [Syntrophothermus sp.]
MKYLLMLLFAISLIGCSGSKIDTVKLDSLNDVIAQTEKEIVRAHNRCDYQEERELQIMLNGLMNNKMNVLEGELRR